MGHLITFGLGWCEISPEYRPRQHGSNVQPATRQPASVCFDESWYAYLAVVHVLSDGRVTLEGDVVMFLG